MRERFYHFFGKSDNKSRSQERSHANLALCRGVLHVYVHVSPPQHDSIRDGAFTKQSAGAKSMHAQHEHNAVLFQPRRKICRRIELRFFYDGAFALRSAAHALRKTLGGNKITRPSGRFRQNGERGAGSSAKRSVHSWRLLALQHAALV